MRVRLQLKSRLRSNNELIRMNKHKRQKLIDVWAWIVATELNHTGQQYIGNNTKFTCPVKVKITIFRPGGRPWDDANLFGGADKLVADHLVTQRILVDDSSKWLTWEKPEQRTGKAKVIVEIEDDPGRRGET